MKINNQRLTMFLIITVITLFYSIFQFSLNYTWGEIMPNFHFWLIWWVIVSFILSIQSDEEYYYESFKRKIQKDIISREMEDKNIIRIAIRFRTSNDDLWTDLFEKRVVCFFNREKWKIEKFDFGEWKYVSFDEKEMKILEDCLSTYIKIHYWEIAWIKNFINFISKKYKEIFDNDNEYNFKIKIYKI